MVRIGRYSDYTVSDYGVLYALRSTVYSTVYPRTTRVIGIRISAPGAWWPSHPRDPAGRAVERRWVCVTECVSYLVIAPCRARADSCCLVLPCRLPRLPAQVGAQLAEQLGAARGHAQPTHLAVVALG